MWRILHHLWSLNQDFLKEMFSLSQKSLGSTLPLLGENNSALCCRGHSEYPQCAVVAPPKSLKPDPPSPRSPCATICTRATSSQTRRRGCPLWGTGDRHSGQLNLVHPLHISRLASSWVCDVDEAGRTQGAHGEEIQS